MSRRASSVILGVFLLLPISALGADLTGPLLYDGEPLSTIFTDITTTYAIAILSGGGARVEGTVDLATDTCSFTGLEAGRHYINIYLDRTDPPSTPADHGDLSGGATVEITDPQSTVEQDFDLGYVYRIVSPVDSDSPLNGLLNDCTAHPAETYPITFTIEPPPRATDYTFITWFDACPGGNIGIVEIDATQPSAQIEWGTANEDFQRFAVRCTGASGRPLCNSPQLEYADGWSFTLHLRNRDSSGRAIHLTDAVVIPAVAGTPGAQGTYWSSALSVTNLAITDRQIAFTYTPRDTDGLDSYTTTVVDVPASSQLDWTDVLAELFSTTGAGALELRGHDLAVTSRTSTPGAAEGSYGQGIPPLRPKELLSVAGTASAVMGGVEEGPAFRTNLGLCEVWGEAATVTVIISDDSMRELGRRNYLLRPYENTQINKVATEVAGLTAFSGGIVEVIVVSGDGRVGAYLSVVDSATGDPTYIAIAHQSPKGG